MVVNGWMEGRVESSLGCVFGDILADCTTLVYNVIANSNNERINK